MRQLPKSLSAVLSRLSRLFHSRTIASGMSIRLEYPIQVRPRYGYGRKPHQSLHRLINARRAEYGKLLAAFPLYKSSLWRISSRPARDPLEPVWINGFLSAFDAMTLYVLIRQNRPRRYVEIGSGHSTRFARRAVQDEGLDTRILSIDPMPRAEIRDVADEVIPRPLEEIDLDLFDSLESGDIVFVDSSHRVFTNSDVTVFFLDVLQKLKPGVLLHFHDIFLPADYPPEWGERYYSEQYLLACSLLAGNNAFEIVLANAFISGDQELRAIIEEIWNHPSMEGSERHGCSFWLRMV